MKNITAKQKLSTKYFQASQPKRTFQKGDQVLWCPKDPKIKRTKFESILHGPYRVQLVLPNNTVLLVNNDNYDKQATIVNSGKLKHYHAASPDVSPTMSLGQLHETLAAEAKITAQQADSKDSKDTMDSQGNSKDPEDTMDN
jgi:hypothetical protein